MTSTKLQSKSNPSPFRFCPHWAITPPTLMQTSAKVTKYAVSSDSWTSSNYQMSVMLLMGVKPYSLSQSVSQSLTHSLNEFTVVPVACLTYKILSTSQPNYLQCLLCYHTSHCASYSVNQHPQDQPLVSIHHHHQSA